MTASNRVSPTLLPSLAILPIKENAAFPGLAQRLEVALTAHCRSTFPQGEILDAQTLLQRLQSRTLGHAFGLWRSAYEGGAPLETSSLAEFGQAARANYFFLITSLHLARNRILPRDTGYGGAVRDSDNTQRTDLKLTGQLLDTQRQRIVWEGVGYAENIDTGKKKLDLGLVIFQGQSRQLPEFIDEMIQVAAQGMVTQVAKAFSSPGTMTSSGNPSPPAPLAASPPSAPLSSPPHAVPQQEEPQAPFKVAQLLLQYKGAPFFSAPDTASEKLGNVDAGLKLRALEERNAWVFIETPSGQRGWILKEWLRK